MTLSRRRAPLTLLLIGVALLAALLLIPWAVHAQSNSTAPTNLTAEVVDGGIALSWDAPTEDADSVTGYEVLRRRPRQGENSLSTYVADTGSATTTYTDTNATEPGERYVYRVKALRVGEKSGRSNYVRVDLPESEPEPASTPEPTPAPTPEPTPAPTPQTSTPDSPTGLTASSVSHDSVTLSWDDPDDDSITGYRVLRRSRDGDEYGDGEGSAEFVPIVDDTGSPAASYTDTSVTARTRYVYRAKAINPAGLSERSSYLNVETLAEPVTTTVVVVPPEQPEEPEVALQQQVTIIDRGTLTVDPRLPTRGTIGSPGERHRYEVELQADRFYDLYIREGSTGEIRLLDQLGDPVQDNGRDLVSAPHAAWGGGGGGRISLLPADHQGHIRGGGAGQRRPADGLRLLRLDGTRRHDHRFQRGRRHKQLSRLQAVHQSRQAAPGRPRQRQPQCERRPTPCFGRRRLLRGEPARRPDLHVHLRRLLHQRRQGQEIMDRCPWARNLPQLQQLQSANLVGRLADPEHHDNAESYRGIRIHDRRFREYYKYR